MFRVRSILIFRDRVGLRASAEEKSVITESHTVRDVVRPMETQICSHRGATYQQTEPFPWTAIIATLVGLDLCFAGPKRAVEIISSCLTSRIAGMRPYPNGTLAYLHTYPLVPISADARSGLSVVLFHLLAGNLSGEPFYSSMLNVIAGRVAKVYSDVRADRPWRREDNFRRFSRFFTAWKQDWQRGDSEPVRPSL